MLQPAADSSAAGLIGEVMGEVPSPEFAYMMVENCRELLDRLGDDTLKIIALCKMEGDSNEEIARKLNYTVAVSTANSRGSGKSGRSKTTSSDLTMVEERMGHSFTRPYLVDEVLDDFENAWQSGQRPSIEKYVARLPSATPNKLLAHSFWT